MIEKDYNAMNEEEKKELHSLMISSTCAIVTWYGQNSTVGQTYIQ